MTANGEFSKHLLESIRQRVSLKDVVSEHDVKLKAEGSRGEWRGRCPFHDDRSPSFYANEERGVYLCHGCGERGDVFSFIMAVEGLGFPDAVRMLADRCGIPLRNGTGNEDDYDPKILQAAREEADEAKAREDQEAVLAVWNEAGDHDPEHPYLAEKRIEDPVGIRQAGDELYIPLKTFEVGYPITAVQRILKNGRKFYVEKSHPKGSKFTIGSRAWDSTDPTGTIYVCEGWATGHAIHRCTDRPVVVAFSTNNLTAVATGLRKRYKTAQIIVAADNDRWSKIQRYQKEPQWNPGVTFALEAAEEAEVDYAIPDFESLEGKPTDYWDLWDREGEDAVRTWLDPARADEAGTESATLPDVDEEDPGQLDRDEPNGPLASVREIEAEPWPESPRLPGPPEPNALPVDALPAGVRNHVESVADNLQVPPDLPLLLGLGTLSAALAGKLEVQVRSGWREPVGIYTASILPPAARKSPAFAIMTEPIRRWEMEAVERAAPKILAAMDVVGVAQNSLENTMKKAAKLPAKDRATTKEVESARQALEEALARVPPDGRLLAGDITPEAMVQRMAVQGGRLALLEPEPGPLQLVAGTYSKGVPRLNELKKAWSAETLLVDRVGRPPLRVRRPALTIALCLQPGVLEALQNGTAFRVEGVMGRILWCQPPHGLGSRLTGPDVPPLDERARNAFVGIMGILLEAEAAGEEEDGTPTPHVLRLDPAALDVLHAYEAEIEEDLGDRGRFAGIRDWAGKAVGQSVRVAALLELAARAGDRRPLYSEPIGPWAMESAVRLLRALSTHALHVLGGIGMDNRTELLKYVLRRAQELVENPPPEEEGGASLRNLWQTARGRSEIDSMDDLTPLVDRLQERGCLRLVEVPREGPGRAPSPRIEIHPSLADSIPTIPTIALDTPFKRDSGDSGGSASEDGNPSDPLKSGVGAPKALREGVPAEREALTGEDCQHLEDERVGMQEEEPEPMMTEVDHV